MRYTYCDECGEPIRGHSTFHESVVLGKSMRKKLKPTCGISEPYCRDCFIKLRKQFKKKDCKNPNCLKHNNGICEYLKDC